jgi:small subunit ribosomal protein S2
VDYVIPGNDDAIRSISLIARLISNACLDGASKASGLGSKKDGPVILRKSEVEESEESEESSSEEKSEELSSSPDGPSTEKSVSETETMKDLPEEKKE